MCERTCARDREIEVNMTVKKEMSPDTVIKLRFDPSDTADVVYQRFNAKVQEVKNVLEDTSFGLCRYAKRNGGENFSRA